MSPFNLFTILESSLFLASEGWFQSLLLVFKSPISARAKPENHRCDSQRIRSVLLIVLCWSSNQGRLHKWNTWRKSPYCRAFTHFYDYFLFLDAWGTFIVVWDSHTDVNWHIVDTWLLWFFAKLENWTSSSGGLPFFALLSYFLLSLAAQFFFVADPMLASPEYFQWVELYLIIWL